MQYERIEIFSKKTGKKVWEIASQGTFYLVNKFNETRKTKSWKDEFTLDNDYELYEFLKEWNRGYEFEILDKETADWWEKTSNWKRTF